MDLLKKICMRIKESGGNAYIAGGVVRDRFLGKKSKDLDVEIHDIDVDLFEKILSEFGNWRFVGKSFKIYILKGIEFSFPVKNEILSPFLSVEEACLRRDFTMNSMLYDPISGKTLDLYNGKKDISNRLIKYVNKKTFLLDPVRILRAAQFKSRFEFNIEKETEKICVLNKELLKSVAKERIFVEIEKILLKSKKPSIAFRWMKKTGILDIIMPEISNLSKIEQGKKYHPEGDVFEHTMQSIDSIHISKRDLSVMFSILYHDIGKAHVENIVDEDNIHFYGHENRGADVVKEYLENYTGNKEFIAEVENLVRYHMHPVFYSDKISKKSIRRVASKVDVEKLCKVCFADINGRGKLVMPNNIDIVLKIYYEIKDEIKPILFGRDLIKIGLKPGTYFGQILKEMYEAQLDGKFLSKEEGLKYLKNHVESSKKG